MYDEIILKRRNRYLVLVSIIFMPVANINIQEPLKMIFTNLLVRLKC